MTEQNSILAHWILTSAGPIPGIVRTNFSVGSTSGLSSAKRRSTDDRTPSEYAKAAHKKRQKKGEYAGNYAALHRIQKDRITVDLKIETR
jgi:hypothetical protein